MMNVPFLYHLHGVVFYCYALNSLVLIIVVTPRPSVVHESLRSGVF